MYFYLQINDSLDKTTHYTFDIKYEKPSKVVIVALGYL